MTLVSRERSLTILESFEKNEFDHVWKIVIFYVSVNKEAEALLYVAETSIIHVLAVKKHNTLLLKTDFDVPLNCFLISVNNMAPIMYFCTHLTH
jgi:hypothetical protein